MYELHKVKGDGECLFNAIAYGILFKTFKIKPSLFEYKRIAKSLRKYVVEQLQNKINGNNLSYIYSMAFELRNRKEENLKKRAKAYVKHMSKSCSWGGQIELSVMDGFLKKYKIQGVQVLDDDFQKIERMHTKFNKKLKYSPIFIQLHGVSKQGGLGVHFNFLQKTQNSHKRSRCSSIHK